MDSTLYFFLYAAPPVAALWLLQGLRRRDPLIAQILLLLLLLPPLLVRGLEIRYLPLTDKLESFLGFALVLTLTALYNRRGSSSGQALAALVALVFITVALFFDAAIHYPSPLLVTVWSVLHVPLSFAGYGFWILAAGDGLDLLLHPEREAELNVDLQENLRNGFWFFSVAMIAGAVWGLVSWGAYFLWDAKIVWSLAAWIYFAALLHMRNWPVRNPLWRAVWVLLGGLIVLFTYVGTSFMAGSIHAF